MSSKVRVRVAEEKDVLLSLMKKRPIICNYLAFIGAIVNQDRPIEERLKPSEFITPLKNNDEADKRMLEIEKEKKELGMSKVLEEVMLKEMTKGTVEEVDKWIEKIKQKQRDKEKVVVSCYESKSNYRKIYNNLKEACEKEDLNYKVLKEKLKNKNYVKSNYLLIRRLVEVGDKK